MPITREVRETIAGCEWHYVERLEEGGIKITIKKAPPNEKHIIIFIHNEVKCIHVSTHKTPRIEEDMVLMMHTDTLVNALTDTPVHTLTFEDPDTENETGLFVTLLSDGQFINAEFLSTEFARHRSCRNVHPRAELPEAVARFVRYILRHT